MAGLITSPRHTVGLHLWGQSHTPHKVGESPLVFSLTLVAVVSLGRGSQPLLVAEDLR